MKLAKYIIILLSASYMSSCDLNEANPTSSIVGTWEMDTIRFNLRDSMNMPDTVITFSSVPVEMIFQQEGVYAEPNQVTMPGWAVGGSFGLFEFGSYDPLGPLEQYRIIHFDRGGAENSVQSQIDGDRLQLNYNISQRPNDKIPNADSIYYWYIGDIGDYLGDQKGYDAGFTVVGFQNGFDTGMETGFTQGYYDNYLTNDLDLLQNFSDNYSAAFWAQYDSVLADVPFKNGFNAGYGVGYSKGAALGTRNDNGLKKVLVFEYIFSKKP